MSTSQARPTTPPTEHGPSLTPPTFEEINLCQLSIAIESNESDAVTVIAATETGDANGYSYRKASVHVPQCVLIYVYLTLIVNAVLLSAIIIILIQLLRHANHYQERRIYLIYWGIGEVLWRLCLIGYTAGKASATYTMIHLLGMFLGKEHYLILVNSFWPDFDPFEADANISGIRIDSGLNSHCTVYSCWNLVFGIWFWVATWIAVNHSSDDYAKSLAITGLSACLINVVTCYLPGAYL
ncbi:10803_t:CDS:2, partial [Paraglomus occultum]